MISMQSNPVLKWVKWRIANNKNCIIVINGPTGSSKSYDALTLGHQISEMLGTNFTVDQNVSFSFVDMLKKSRLDVNKKPGTCFMFEEVGAFGGGASSREWQSKANKFFFSFMQTTRHRRQILIFTCPQFDFLEKGARSLVHMHMTTAGIDFSRRIAYARVKVLQTNSITGKVYWKNLRFKDTRGSRKMKYLAIPHPPMELVQQYEVVKTAFTDKMQQTIIDETDRLLEKEDRNTPKPLGQVLDIDRLPSGIKAKYIDKAYIVSLLEQGESLNSIALKAQVTPTYVRNIKYAWKMSKEWQHLPKNEPNPLENEVLEPRNQKLPPILT